MIDENTERLIESISSLEGAIFAQLVILARIYDLLAVTDVNNENIAKVLELHEVGSTLSNAPFLNEESVKRWNGE